MTDTDRRDAVELGTRREDRSVIVAIGAGAGCEAALETLLTAIGNASGMAFVLALQVEADEAETIRDQLSTIASCAIRLATQRVLLEPNTVYLCLSASCPTIKDGWLDFTTPSATESSPPPIDRFLCSVADDLKEFGIGVVLSGVGSDGTLGLKAISDAGGVTFAQDATSAAFDTMPRSAATTGVADYILSPDKIAAALLEYREYLTNTMGMGTGEALTSQIEAAIPEIAEILLQTTQQNFKHYRSNTLVRRICRRMQVLKDSSVSDYLERLRNDESEARHLFRELLIGVTGFFRDPEAFQSLATSCLLTLIRGRQKGDTVRIWVAGCASGEEAYSLAILCRESVEGFDNPPKIQIFATDIDNRALSIARAGVYPLGIKDHVTPERLQRFFIRRGKRFEVTKEIRDLIQFSHHNLISDPPFARQDLISCRNLMIYLGSHLQNKLIPQFHYALRPGGYLFLGPSEDVTDHGELFRPIDPKHRISQRKGTVLRDGDQASENTNDADEPSDSVSSMTPEVDLTAIRQRIVLDEFSPKSMVVDGAGRILNVSANMDRFLVIENGDVRNHVVHLVKPELRRGLRAALREASKVMRKVEYDGLSIRVDGEQQRVMITVQPMPEQGSHQDLFLVVFHDVGLPTDICHPNEPVARVAGEAVDVETLLTHTTQELESTRRDLHRAMQDMEAANEELKASNEELLAMNEQLQAANEELETSREEVRSISEAVSQANSDLSNLLQSSQIASIFLDLDLRIRNFTPAIRDIYGLLPTDIGRPLDQFAALVDAMPVLPSLAELIRGETREHTVIARSGKSFIRRVFPYRSGSGKVDGMVMTFIDVTELRERKEQLAARERQLRTIADALPPLIAFVDKGLRYQFANAAYAAQWKRPVQEILGRTVPEVVGKENYASIRDRLSDAIRGQKQVYELRLVDPETRKIQYKEVTYIPQHGASGEVDGCHVLASDITDRKQAELNLEFLTELRTEYENLGSTIELMDHTTTRVARFLNFCRCVIVEFDPSVEFGEVIHEYNGTDFKSLLGRHCVADFHTAGEQAALLKGEQFYCDDVDGGTHSISTRNLFQSLGIASYCHSAYVTEQGIKFVVATMKGEPHDWPAHERKLLQDVTNFLCVRIARTRAETSLADREAHLRRVINNQLGYVGLINRDGRLLEMDDRSLRAAGLRREDVIDKDFAEAAWWTYDDAVADQMRAAVRRGIAGETVRFDIGMYRQQGEPMLVDFMLAPVFDNNGRVEFLVPSAVDISARKSIENQLRANAEELDAERTKLVTLLANYERAESKLKVLFDSNYYYTGIVELDGTTTDINEIALKQLGATREEATNRPFWDCPWWGESELVRWKLRDGLRRAVAGEVYREDLPFWLPDGTERIADFIFTPARDQRGNVVFVVASSSDVTEVRRSAEELTKRDRHLKLALKGGRLGTWEWDPATGRVTLSEELLEIYGLDQDQTDCTIADALNCVHPDDRESASTRLTAAIEGSSREYRFDWRIVRADNGNVVWTENRGLINRNANGNPILVTGVTSDVTERKQAELALADINKRLSMAINAGELAVWEWTEKKSVWEPALFDLLGISPDVEPSTERFFELVHPDDLPALREAWAKTTRGEEPYDHQFRIVRPDGQIRWLAGVGDVTYDSHGQLTRIHGLNWDITEQKELQESLERARAMAEAANDSKSAFLANMSHEIRTPMTAIMGYTDLVIDLVENPEAISHLHTIRRNGNFLLGIINDILDLSKIEAGKLDVVRERFAPDQLVEDVRSIMEVRAKENNLDLEVRYDGLIPAEIESDPKRLKQILINLVGNAIKFTKQGWVKVKVRHADSQLRIDIVDSGIGMSTEQSERLFQPFHQGDHTVNREYGGTGLGLAISQRLANMLGGEIRVHSEPGKGSTFSVAIDSGNLEGVRMFRPNPTVDTIDEPAPTEQIELDCHVLVVDDRRDIRLLSKRFLSIAGAEVTEAEDGEKAVAVVRDAMRSQVAIDLVLLDMQMPRLDGYETAKSLRGIGFKNPIIALTADAMQGDMSRCIECGCNDYLSKPIDKDAMLEMVKRYLDESRT
jgi:PAS domain S-box-containing protein